MAASALTFRATTFNAIERNGQPWLRAAEIAQALGYSRTDKVTELYSRNSSEFTEQMSRTLTLGVRDSDGVERPREVRIFSLRGAHLIGMFARTDLAAEFRKWVLDVLDQRTQALPTDYVPALPTDYAQALRALACEVEEKERIAAAKAAADAELVLARPKAVACDVLSASEGERGIRDAAKDLKVQERRLIGMMLAKGWLYRTKRPDGTDGELRPAAIMTNHQFARMVPVFVDAAQTKTRDALRITNAGLTRLAVMIVRWGLVDPATATAAVPVPAGVPLLSFSGHPGYLAALQVLLQRPDPGAVAGLVRDMDALGAELARAQANPAIQEPIPSADEMIADPSLVRRTLDNNRAMNSIIIMGAAGLLSSARRALQAAADATRSRGGPACRPGDRRPDVVAHQKA